MAVDLGKSPSFFAAYKAQGKSPGMKTLLLIQKKYDINPNYIIEGERPVFLAGEKLGDSSNRIVPVKELMTYTELKFEDTDLENWEMICDKYDFRSATNSIYKVKSQGFSMYYTERQFKELFRSV